MDGRDALVTVREDRERVAAAEVDVGGVERQRDVGGVGQFEQPPDLVRPLDRPPDVRVGGQADAEVGRAPPQLVERPGDRPQVGLARAARWPRPEVDLKVLATEDGQEVAGEGQVIVDRPAAGRGVDEVDRLAGAAVRAGRHRDPVPVEDRLEIARPLQPGHEQLAVGLDAWEAERGRQGDVLRCEFAEDKGTHREPDAVRPRRCGMAPYALTLHTLTLPRHHGATEARVTSPRSAAANASLIRSSGKVCERTRSNGYFWRVRATKSSACFRCSAS